MKTKISNYQKKIGLTIRSDMIVFQPKGQEDFYRLDSHFYEKDMLQDIYKLGVRHGKDLCQKRFFNVFR